MFTKIPKVTKVTFLILKNLFAKIVTIVTKMTFVMWFLYKTVTSIFPSDPLLLLSSCQLF
jgi:hypothetical protein